MVTSPPAVIGDLVVVGSAIGDNRAVESERGIVRAFDAAQRRAAAGAGIRSRASPATRGTTPGRAGSPTAPAAPTPGRRSRPTPSATSSSCRRRRPAPTTTAASAWARTSTPTASSRCAPPPASWSGIPDRPSRHLGLRRADAAGADHARARRRRACRRSPSGTKQGHIFVLHRETGEPLFPVEERPVPQTDVPGEETWPTQPFPAQLPLFGLRELTPDDAWGPTPEDREPAAQVIAALRSEGPFTPISLQGTIQTPSNAGGFNWGGLSYDPARQIAGRRGQPLRRGHATHAARRGRQQTRTAASGSAWRPGSRGHALHALAQLLLDPGDGASRSVHRRGAPWRPSISRDGTLAWEVPLGLVADPAEVPDALTGARPASADRPPLPVGSSSSAPPSTASSAPSTSRPANSSGRIQLPAGGQATPMSYEHEGRQYVVIAAGGHGNMGSHWAMPWSPTR